MTSPVPGKQKAARVRLDYHKQTDRLKRYLAIAVIVVTPLVVGAYLWRKNGGLSSYSPGPVHAVHATWETQCTRCHVPFSPSSRDNFLMSLTATAAPTDACCKSCHEGPPHHDRLKPEEVLHCAGCHREHRGRETSLVLVPDGDCISCHASLGHHHTQGVTRFHDEITAFDGGHPPFNVLDRTGMRVGLAAAKDPGRLKFNHALHTRKGLKHQQDDVRPWTLGDIKDETERQRYRCMQPAELQAEGDPIKLSCASCHQLDSAESASRSNSKRGLAHGIFPPRSGGEYFLPVTYENHCHACHPLTFDAGLPRVEIPHHLQPAEVHRFLWGVYAEDEVKDAGLREKLRPSRPLPGKAVAQQEDRIRGLINTERNIVETFLYQAEVKRQERYIYSGKTTCGECHEFELRPGEVVPVRIVPPAVPEIWLPHAKFSHLAHRAADCLACHRDADAYLADGVTPNSKASTKSESVLLPRIETCQQCHNKGGGARFDCTECHRYHHGKRPQLGIGAAARDPKKRLSVKEFLSGQSSVIEGP